MTPFVCARCESLRVAAFVDQSKLVDFPHPDRNPDFDAENAAPHTAMRPMQQPARLSERQASRRSATTQPPQKNTPASSWMRVVAQAGFAFKQDCSGVLALLLPSVRSRERKRPRRHGRAKPWLPASATSTRRPRTLTPLHHRPAENCVQADDACSRSRSLSDSQMGSRSLSHCLRGPVQSPVST